MKKLIYLLSVSSLLTLFGACNQSTETITEEAVAVDSTAVENVDTIQQPEVAPETTAVEVEDAKPTVEEQKNSETKTETKAVVNKRVEVQSPNVKKVEGQATEKVNTEIKKVEEKKPEPSRGEPGGF